MEKVVENIRKRIKDAGDGALFFNNLAHTMLDGDMGVGIARNHLHHEETTDNLADVLVVGVHGHIRAGTVVEPLVERHDVARREVFEGLNLAKTLQGLDSGVLVLTCARTDILIVHALLHVFDEVSVLVNTVIEVFGHSHLCLSAALILTYIIIGVEVLNAQLEVENRDCREYVLALAYYRLYILAARKLLKIAALAPADGDKLPFLACDVDVNINCSDSIVPVLDLTFAVEND